MKTARALSRLVACAALATALAAPALRSPGAAAAPPEGDDEGDKAPAGQVVSLPHAVRDDAGFTWNVNQDGSIADANGAVFTAGGQLILGPGGNFQYASPTGQATFDAARNEVTFPPMPAAGLSVSRRVAVEARGGWCRFVEVLENPADHPVRTQVRLRFHLTGVVQQVQAVHANGGRNGDRGAPGGGAGVGPGAAGGMNAVAVSDGDDAVVLIGAGRGGRVAPQFQAQPEADFVDLAYEVEVPPRKTVAVVHVQARRATLNEAVAFARSAKDRQFLKGLDRPLLKAVVNFPPADRFIVGAEVMRGDLLDVVELRGGDVYKGTIRHDTYQLKTPYGLIELPAARVLGMVTLGEFRPVQLLVTDGGEVFGGALQTEAIRLELSSGQVTTVPLASVRRLGYRLRPEESEGEAGAVAAAPAAAAERPVVMLRGGDRIVVATPAGPIPVATSYGVLRLDPRAVASVAFQSDEHGVHEVRLVDGSRFAGVVAQDKFDLTLAGAAAGGGAGAKPVPFATISLSRLQLAPDVTELPPDAATMKLANGDLLVGSLAGKLVLETAFDAIEVNAEELSGLRPGGEAAADVGATPAGEVQLALWDGATLSGRVRGDVVECVLRSGTTVRVPVAMVRKYVQPAPRPSERAVERIRRVVEQLDDDDWKVRDRAAAQLEAMGPGAAAVLRRLRDGQPPEVRQRIDQILAPLDPAAARPAPTPPALDQPTIPVEPAGAEVIDRG